MIVKSSKTTKEGLSWTYSKTGVSARRNDGLYVRRTRWFLYCTAQPAHQSGWAVWKSRSALLWFPNQNLVDVLKKVDALYPDFNKGRRIPHGDTMYMFDCPKCKVSSLVLQPWRAHTCQVTCSTCNHVVQNYTYPAFQAEPAVEQRVSISEAVPWSEVHNVS